MILARTKHQLTKKGIHMKRSLCFLILMYAGSANAMVINDFTGPYSASNWNVTPGEGITVNNSNPLILDFEAGNPLGSSTARLDSVFKYETVAAETGTVSFDLSLHLGTFTTPAPRGAFVTEINGVAVDVRDDDIDLFNSFPDHIDLAVTAGQTFGFKLLVDNFAPGNIFGADISGFSAPAAVSEPGILLLTGLGLLSLVGFRRRQKQL